MGAMVLQISCIYLQTVELDVVSDRAAGVTGAILEEGDTAGGVMCCGRTFTSGESGIVLVLSR